MDTNMAQCLQQAQLCTAMTNLTITQQNEACNDHQTINSKEKKHIPLLITSLPLWHEACGRKPCVEKHCSPCLLPAKLYCQPEVRVFFISLFF